MASVLWSSAVVGALMFLLLWMSVSRYTRARRAVHFGLSLFAMAMGARELFFIYGAWRGAAALPGYEALRVFAAAALVVAVMCEASGRMYRAAITSVGPALLCVAALVFALGAFGVEAAVRFAAPAIQAALALAVIGIALSRRVASPHYAVQGALFLIVEVIAAVLWRQSVWPAALARSCAAGSLILYAASLPGARAAAREPDDDANVRTLVFQVCARTAAELREIDSAATFEEWFGRGLDVIARALREHLGFQHVSLAQWNGPDAPGQVTFGFLLPGGQSTPSRIRIQGALIRSLAGAGEPLVSADVREDPRLAGCAFDSLEWHSAALIPLPIRNRPETVLIVGDRPDGRPLDDNDTLACILIRDFLSLAVTHLYTRSELFAAADMDPVTLQSNYSAFQKILEETMDGADKSGGAFALALFDIDKFYTLNDRLGFQRGDKVLRDLGNTVRGYAENGHVGRVGPDEFAILIRGGGDEVREKIENILKDINAVASEMCPEAPISVSVAFTIYPYDFLEQTSVFGKMREALAAGSSSKGRMLRVKCS